MPSLTLLRRVNQGHDKINGVQTSLEPILRGYRDVAQDSNLDTADTILLVKQSPARGGEYAEKGLLQDVWTHFSAAFLILVAFPRDDRIEFRSQRRAPARLFVRADVSKALANSRISTYDGA